MDRHSRIVAWLKIVLPLFALGLLSTLFLLSRSFNPNASLPFADSEISERLQNQRVTAPRFAGVTRGGDQVLITAGTMMTGRATGNLAEDLSAQIDLASGSRLLLISKAGSLDLEARVVRLQDGVALETSSGFDMKTDQLNASLDELVVFSPGPIFGSSPFGSLEAGSMRLERPDSSNSAQLVFTNGVKLIYDPQRSKE